MKIIFILLHFLVTTAWANDLSKSKIKIVNGSETELASLNKNGPILLVNIATRCGYTSQLDDLEKLYVKYQKQGLVILGIPSNDFAGQTPEGDKEVAEFCRLKFGVTFPITEKIKVVGDQKHPIYQKLIEQNGNKEIGWNFEKFLFDKNWKFIGHFKSGEEPLDSNIEKEIVKLLKN